MNTMDKLLSELLYGQLQSIGLFTVKNQTIAECKAKLHDRYGKWLEESIAVLVQHKYLAYDGESLLANDTTPIHLDSAWKKWEQEKTAWLNDPNSKAQVILVETTMRVLPEILLGKIPATEIMFPNSSMELVEGIYKHNEVADYFNEVLANTIVTYVKQRLEQDASARIRILEIGAGTGGTSAIVLPRLKPFQKHIEEYCYTDLSQAFLLHAEKEYGAENPYLTYRIFNVEKPVEEQGIAADSYDLVIATNVLHATKNIGQTLLHAKTTLQKNGLLILNELTSNTLFAHLTFGLLDGWWRYDDPEWRIPGCPLLTVETWQKVLKKAGYRSVFLPAEEHLDLCQQIIVAESDGVIRRSSQPRQSAGTVAYSPAKRQASNLKAKPLKKQVPVRTTPAKKSGGVTEEWLREKSTAYIKKLISETLRIPTRQIKSSAPLEQYGIDSILVVQLTNSLRKDFANMSSTIFFEYQTIDALVEYLIETQKEALLKVTGVEAQEAIDEAYPNELENEGMTDSASTAYTNLPVRKTRRFLSVREQAGKESITHSSVVRDVAIIGLSGRYPQAKNVDEFWNRLKEGKNCISEIPKDRWDWKSYFDEEKGKQDSMYTKWGGFIEDMDKFDPLFFQISPKEAEEMDPQERLFLQEAYASIEDAGYTPATLCESRKVGVFVGVMNGNYPTGATYWSIANRLSYLLNFQGPSVAVDTACSASLTAIHFALESLYSGTSECAIAGGVNLIVDPVHYMKLSALTMLSPSNQCKSFGDQADGFVDGEGVGAIVLKPLDKAIADGDHIYGVIKGSMMNAGGKTNGYTVPNPQAQAQLVADALQRAKVHARTVSYLEAHGTGTELGDPIEVAGLTRAFEKDTQDKQFCALGSAKSNIGHCESAAGIAGVTKILLQLKHGQLVPSLHSSTLNPNIDFSKTPFVVQQELAEWKRPIVEINGTTNEYPRIAGISSFGAGGSNAHVIIEEYIPEEQQRSSLKITLQNPAIFVLSAKNAERLYEKAQQLLAFIQKHGLTDADLADMAYTLQVGRVAMEERIAVIAGSVKELQQKLTAYVDGQEHIGDLYRGQINRNQEMLDILTSDDELEETIARWMERGKYSKLLDLWVKGLSIDWNKLYQEEQPRRISLPTYPFAKESYWIEAKSSGNSSTGVGAIHPFLHQNTSDFMEQRFSSTFTGQEFFLSDHVIKGQRILPSAAYLEMARAAIQVAAGGLDSEQKQEGLRFKNVVWTQPLAVGSEPVQAHIELYPEANGEIVFEIYSDSKEDQNQTAETVHSQGSAVLCSIPDIPPFDLNALREQCNLNTLSAEQCYEVFKKMGVDYGLAHRGIEQILIGQGQVLAKLSLPSSVAKTQGQFGLHPSLIDAALQASLGLMMATSDFSLILPFALEELEIVGACSASMWALIRYREGSKAGDKVEKFDIDLCDENGNVRVRMKGFSTRKIANESVKSEGEAPKASVSFAEEKAVDSTSLMEQATHYFKKLLSSVIKLPVAKMEADASLEKYGVDSIVAMQMTKELEKQFGSLPKTLFFEYQTIKELTGYFLENHRESLMRTLGMGENAEAPLTLAQEPEATIADERTVQQPGRRNKKRKSQRFASLRMETQRQNGALDIAIIGVSGRYPQASNIHDFWKNLRDGKDCITEIPKDRWDHSLYFDETKDKIGKSYSKWGGFIDGVDQFDPLFFHISPREAELMDPQERLFLQCVYETIEDAGYTRETLGKLEGLGGNVGVYVGVMYEEYQLYASAEQALGRALTIAGSPASIANRVSYFCNFHGPSMAVDTMCSSSLTGIHLACHSLQRGECEVAIAGGVNVSIHPNKYLYLSQGKFASSKGRCESFGEGGDGYVPGEGVGAVLLKPLARAIADGDHIYGVIKGSAINHGGKTNGYTVPNPHSQSRVIRRAFEEAGIHPRTVSYIEAHGTGTSLGDPIEIAGLTKTFQEYTKENQFCAIGSAKSNIGHGESAAGIAGLTKILLQMKYKKLVPSLHSSTLNPNIDFSKTPFVVQQELTEWKRPVIEINGVTREYPRIAGISSFGAGGANAHLVIEEYREEEQRPPISISAKNPAVIVLSAKNKDRLREQVQRLLSAIREQMLTDDDLAEIAYTLQIGREAMEERLAVIVKSISELEAKLTFYLEDEDDRQDLFMGQVKRNKETMDVFAADEDLQQAIDTWITKGKYAKILQMWVQGLIFDWNKLYGDTKPRRISLPAYPFARERYWLPKVKSQAIGYIGAGALGTLHPMLHENTSTLSEQRHSSTFTGQEFFLRDHVVKGQKVLPGVAYLEMARVAVDLATGVRSDNQSAIQLKNIVWAKPVIVEDAPIQVHTGLYPEENGEIAFEIYSQPREAEENLVVHSQGRAVLRSAMEAPALDLSAIQAQCTESSYSFSQCYETFQGIGLAYGPSHQGIEELFVGKEQVLAKLALPSSVTDTAGKFVLHPSIMDAALQAPLGFMMGTSDLQPSLPFALEQLNIYSASTTAVWALVRYSDGNAVTQKVQKLDIDLCDEQGKVCVSMKGFTTRMLEGEKAAGGAKSKGTGEAGKITSTLMLQPAWIEKAIPKEANAPEYEQHVVMLCEPGKISGESLSSQINSARVLVLKSDQQGIAERFQAYAVQAFEEIKALLQAKPKGKVLIQIVVPLRSEQRLFAGLAGLLKTAQIENPKVIGQLIEIDSTEDSAGLAEKLKANSLCPADCQIRYQLEKRFIAGWSEAAAAQHKASMPWKDNGIYLITGGAGGLGLIFAEEMAEQARGITLILTGRSALTAQKQAKLRKLGDNGARIEYRQVDVSQKQAVEDLIQSIQTEFGDLHGIIHGAGVTRDSFILKKTKEEVQAVLAPKVAGLLHLDEATKGLNLDFFVLFSSAAGSLGNMGQADYATANAFMDKFSAYRNEQIQQGERQGQTLSINWPLWKEGGMQVDAETEKRLWDDLGMVAMRTASGIDCLYRGLASGQDQLMVMEGDRVRMKQRLMGATETSVISTAHSDSLQSEVQASLLKMVADLLKVEKEDIEIHAELNEYGFDQIKRTEFTNKLNQAYELELTPSVLVEYPTLFAISQHLMDAYTDRFIRQFQRAKSASTSAKTEKEQPVSIGQQDVLRAKVREYLKKEISAVIKLPAYKIDEDASLEKYGIDSVMAMQLTNQLEKAFGSLSKTLLYEYQNIEDLTDYLFAHHRDKIIGIMGAGKTAETGAVENVSHVLPAADSITDHRRRFSRFVTHEQANKQTTSERDIAIIGVSGRYPKASHIQEFWNNLREGKDCITEIPQERWDHSLYFDGDKNSPGKAYSKWGGFIDGVDQFDPLFFHISPREAEVMDPQERLFLETVWNLLEEAGHTREVLQRQYENRVGVYVGAMYQPYHAFDTDMEKGSIISLSSYHSIANRVSYFFNLQGPSMAIDTACSSSAIAIYHACESLMKGESSLAIAGGVNVSIHPKKYLGLSQAQMIGSHADSRSFGDGDGYLPAEGVGAVLLKPLAKAIEDGDSILAVIKSVATNHGGRTNGFSVPNPNAQAQLIEENFARAGIDPRTISYVEAAANGSLLGDPIELKALTNAFSKQTDDVQFCAIGSVKSNIGHAEAASGISQLTKVILQLQHQELVPSIKAEQLNPHVHFAETPFYLQKDRQKWERPVVRINGEEREVPRRATISSFGAGGSNAHLILEEYIPPQTEMKSISSAASPQIVVFSAKNADRLRAVAKQMLAFAQQQVFSLADFAYTLQVKREAMECRLAMVVQDQDELIHGLQAYLEAVEQGSQPTASIPIYTGDLEEDLAGVRNLLSGKVGDTVLQVLLAENNLDKLALHWTQGGKIPWESLHPQERRMLSLPTYPFARERYWLSTSEGEQQQLGTETINQPTEKATLAIDINPDSPTEENIQRDMAQFLSRELHLSEGQIKPNKYFLDYGMDSIMVTKLIRHLEQRWNIKIRGREVLENPTMKSLAHLLAIKIKEWSHKEIASTTDFETLSQDSGERTENLAVDMLLQKFKDGLLSLEEIEQLIDKGGMI